MNELAKRGYEGIGSDIKDAYSGIPDGTAVVTMPYVPMDITDKTSVEKVLKEVNPDVVVHCAAWTAVDLAEDEDKKETVQKVNAEGTRNIALVCKELGCKMVYISTDYVFDGQGTEPWEPGAYRGAQKRAGKRRKEKRRSRKGSCTQCPQGR